MNKQPNVGKCNLCGGTFSRAAMTRHLSRCQPGSRQSDRAVKSFHLFVEARGSNAYWLHVAVPVNAPLSKLDRFLRDIWLECCGHLSAFTIGAQRYAYAPMGELEERGMGVALGAVLDVGTKFSYEYDFGSTTELQSKVVGLREPRTKRPAIQLLARNEAPRIDCEQCGTKPARQICSECQWSGAGWLCDQCAADHPCDSEMFLPVVNSPRAGVCGYAG